MSQIKENIAILLGFILGTLIAAGIIFFIVIGFSMIFGVIPTNKTVELMGSEPVGPGGGGGMISEVTGPGEGVSGLYDTYNGMTLAFLFKGGTGVINETECDSDSQQWGENCTCRSCMAWSGYDTEGFINRSGIYYSNGTDTGMPRQVIDKSVELNRTKYPFEFIMQGHNGYTYNGAEWSNDGHAL